jgi:DNA-binding XRE family transcriptional regulator
MTSLSALKKEWMKDPEFKKEYELLAPEFEVAKVLIGARVHAGLTQSEVAKRMGTTQSVIARLEGGNTLPSMKTLFRYAAATGTKPAIQLVPS